MSIVHLTSTRNLCYTVIKRLLPLLLGGLAYLAVLFVWQQLTINEQIHIEQLIQQEANAIESKLSEELSIRMVTLRQMANRWEVSGGTARSLWEADAKAYLEDFYGCQAIEWVDPSFKVRWVVPLAGNELVQNLDLSREPRRQIALQVARDLRQIILTRNISLVQGGKGFLATIPLFVGDRFDGFILGVFKFQALFDSILNVPSGYEVTISDRAARIYSQGVRSQPPSTLQKTVIVRAYGADWRVEVSATPELIANVQSPLPSVVLIGGSSLVLLFVLVVHLSQLNYRQIHQLKKANHQLQREIHQRQQAEIAIDRLAEIVESSEDAIFSENLEDVITSWNIGAELIFGYAAAEIIGQLGKILIPVEYQDRERKIIQRIQQGERIKHYDTKRLRKDGSLIDVSISVSPIKDQLGNIIGAAKIARSIADRKQAEAELQEMSQVLENAVSGISKLDIEGRYLYVNKAYADMTGYQPEEMLGMPWQNTVHPDELNKLVAAYEQMLRDGRVENETIGIRKDGSVFYKQLVMIATYDDRHNFLGHYCFMKDISDRKQTEEALRHQKEMLQTIVDRIPVMIALFDSQGRVEFINPEIERVLGWSLADWQQRNILVDCYPDPVYRQIILEHMTSTTGQWKDVTTMTATGQQLETSWANVRLSSGHCLGIGQDISDRKQKELALQKAMKTAEEANLAKSIFLANMSHELRTPLNVILGFTQVMAHDPALNSHQREDLQTIRRSGDHLLSLINDVLDLSKIESGHYSIEESGFDLIALLHSLRNMFVERAISKGIDFSFDIAPEVPQFILADAQKLRQVLLNLFSNAIKFTKQGSITLRVTSEETIANRQMLQFEVADTGVGIAQSELSTIFDAFVQAQAGKRSASGTGLGLTISRKLLELIGGAISVSSTLGKGSTFTFTLPVSPTSGVNITSEQNDRLAIGLAPGQAHHRILVVDDRAENRLLMVRLLTQLGLEVKEATNGREAVELWQQWQPDLTWMDIRMPVLDGYEATRQIRAMEGGQNSVIIALTAQASQSDRALALAAGCNDYISKPFREQSLFIKMAEYLGLEYIYDRPETTKAEPQTDLFPGYSSSVASPVSDSLKPWLLNALPAEWLLQLEDAAICGDDVEIVKLVTQLSPEFAQLGTHLTELANQYQFERIIQLIQDNFPTGISA